MIYIVRHGKTSWNDIGRNQGRTDIDLNEEGIKQANIVKDKLTGIYFDKVISSPLKRAYKTAQIISNSNDIIVDERIIERCNGTLEGKLREELPKNIDFNSVHNEYGIEPINEFRNRIFDFCKDLEKYDDKNILVVTHAGVGIFMRCFFEGEPIDNNYLSYKLNNCEVLEYKNSKLKE